MSQSNDEIYWNEPGSSKASTSTRSIRKAKSQSSRLEVFHVSNNCDELRTCFSHYIANLDEVSSEYAKILGKFSGTSQYWETNHLNRLDFRGKRHRDKRNHEDHMKEFHKVFNKHLTLEVDTLHQQLFCFFFRFFINKRATNSLKL